MEMIGWTNRTENEEELRGVKEERKILHTIKRKLASLYGTSCVENAL
jgi:hypothetical protein